MADKNAIGMRGEAMFQLALTRLIGPGYTPLFRARQLGEKWPITDFHCELEGHPGYAFLIQAKATRHPL